MIQNIPPRHVQKTYIQWLKDSDLDVDFETMPSNCLSPLLEIAPLQPVNADDFIEEDLHCYPLIEEMLSYLSEDFKVPNRIAMIQNIPPRHLQKTYIQWLKDSDLDVDFFHMSFDTVSGKNRGYAFVGFCKPADAKEFIERYDATMPFQTGSSKKFSITFAKCQSRDKYISRNKTVPRKRGRSAHAPFIFKKLASKAQL